jgi:hypothetical protein
MIGNQIDLYFHGGPQPTIGAAITVLLAGLPHDPDDLLPADRPPRVEGDPGVSQTVARLPSARGPTSGYVQRLRGRLGNPWGKPRFLVLVTWGYIVWAIVPVLVAIQFSFNDSRSLSVWHGFTLKWYTSTDPSIDSVFHSAELHGALEQSLKLAGLDVLIATPIGVFLALGLARWRGRGSGPRTS